MPIGVGRLIRGARGVGSGVAQDPSRVSKGLGRRRCYSWSIIWI
jgi:hypothetical protein